MKFLVKHKRYGYLGMSGDEIEYKDDEVQSAAAFTKDSAARLMVDITDPRMKIERVTDEYVAQNHLFDTDEMLKKQDIEYQKSVKEKREMAGNAFSMLANEIEQLNNPEQEVGVENREKPALVIG